VGVRAQQGADRRRQIIDAAVRAFARRGYEACRVGDIATEAGVAYGLVYHYFHSKEEILETIFRDTWNLMLEAIAGVEELGEPADVQLRKVIAIVLRTWKMNSDLVRVLVREVTRTPHLQSEVTEIQQAFDTLERIVARGQEQGVFSEELEAKLVGWSLYGALEELMTGWVMGQLPGTDEDVALAERSLFALFTRGLYVTR
jgi:TetR/AcrR family transcriptional regulator, fatty acid metabolism regulator protein